MDNNEILQLAREACAAYWRKIGYPKDAEAILAGQSDYSSDMQCVITVLLAREKNIPINAAATAAGFFPHECGSTSRNHREDDLHAN